MLRPAADSAVEVRTVHYRGPDGVELPADIYFNPKLGPARPVLILISGGEDVRNWGQYRDFGRLAAERGYAAIVPAKRFPRGEGGIAKGRADMAALTGALPRLAPDILDPARVCLWGFSGGGTALSLAYGADAPRLACVVGYYPFVSISAPAPEKWLETYSPAHALARYAGPSSPPTLIVRAGLDGEAVNGAIADFVAKAQSRNVPVTLVNLPSARHGFDLYDDTDWARAAISDTFEFIGSAMAGPFPSSRTAALTQELLRLEHERQIAFAKGDRALLERHFGAEYIHTNLRGGTTSREQELNFYAPDRFSLADAEVVDVEVRDYGDTAILLGTVGWKGATMRPPAGAPVDLSGQYRVTRVYAWRDSRWQLVASHASRITGSS